MNIAGNIELRQFAFGVKTGFPIYLGYLPIGIAFGILACEYGFSPVQAILASTLILSGSGQFVALSTLALSGSVFASVLACAVVNLRYALFAVTLSPHLHGLKTRTLAWLGFTITDETFAFNSAQIREMKASPHSMMGLGTISWLGWISGTTIGAIGSQFLGDLSAFGIHFAIAAMYAALFVALANNRQQVYCGLVAGLLCLVLYGINLIGLGLETYWFTIITAIAAASLFVLIIPDKGEPIGPEEQIEQARQEGAALREGVE